MTYDRTPSHRPGDPFADNLPDPLDALELAWSLIANAYQGNWSDAPTEWQEAAARWRDDFWHPLLDHHVSQDLRPADHVSQDLRPADMTTLSEHQQDALAELAVRIELSREARPRERFLAALAGALKAIPAPVDRARHTVALFGPMAEDYDYGLDKWLDELERA